MSSSNGLAPKAILADIVSTLGDDSPNLSTAQKWAAEIKRGRNNAEDNTRSGCPATVTTKENNDHVHHMEMDERRLSINQIANANSRSHERVENIMHIELDKGFCSVGATF